MKKILINYLGISFLLLVVFHILLFSIAMIFGYGDTDIEGPMLMPAIVFALIMGLIVHGLLKWLKPKSQKEAFSYSLSWAGIVLTLILVITIANDTTNVFFGYWYDYLVFIFMAVAPFIPGSFFENDRE